MRLTTIRLAGFKSFVDPTVLSLASNLTGVVGPNGCGKSNVIDAVRWVTGESSARQLRGEALEDVIFNGSKARKPVGRASVELKFDNSEGKLAGQYGAFNEISIKRELSRDGGSRYFINGTKSRRRDVIDLFLGTGLGGRSNYAVIEQGAVNRLIEAKPEDMRQVLEEAAGISKYKERRRETENRIRHTRENLDRLNDLIGEVSQRLGVLKRQAANAEKYKQFKIEERRLRAELLALRWAAQNRQVEAAEQQLRGHEDSLRGAVSALRTAESARDERTRAQQSAMAEVQSQQGAFYDAQARAGRIAQQLAHARELQTLRAREQAELTDRIERLDQRAAEDRRADEDAGQQIAEAQTQRAQAETELKDAQTARDGADQAARDAEQAWDTHNSAEHNPVQQLDAERTRVRYGQERVAQLSRRRDTRHSERERLDDVDTAALAAADDDIRQRAEQLVADEHSAHETAERDERLRLEIADADNALATLRTGLAENRARLASEKKLQQAVLREDDASVGRWLEAQGLGGATGVARRVRVDSAWQTAAEAALGAWLRGFVVEALPQAADDWPDTPLTLVEAAADEARTNTALPALAGARNLAEGIEAPAAIRALAARVFVVDDLAQALALRGELGDEQRLVTLDGCCVGAATLVTPASEAVEKGVLEREARIKDLSARIAQENDRFEADEKALEQRNEQRNETREQRQQLDQQIAEQRRTLEAARARQQGERMRAQQVERRRAEIDTELDDLDKQIAATAADNEALEAAVQTLVVAADDFGSARQQAQANLAAARQTRDSTRQRCEQAERALRDIDARLTQLAGRRESVGTRLSDAHSTRDELALRLAAFDADQPDDGATAAPDAAEHEAAVEAQNRAERELRAARDALKASEDVLQRHAQTLMQAQQQVDSVRESLQQARIDVETAGVRRAGVAEQLEELGEAPQTLIERLPDDAEVARWSEDIDAVERRIQRLGAINLAAIEEYDAEAEREQYLQTQHTDLSDALATLDEAIAKIDRETRSRFKATYEQVNARFAEMFPELFGGGEAALELTEDDWLATGIRVMARPPGKRNASIQMLSGGEKALTAVALLFALFELNPAPFCMLDEIDAPLDDANVSRFCDLVRRMSAQVQFIVITHNKLTMSLAEQLHGVTMAEPGVSRLVSVDIEQALDMAG